MVTNKKSNAETIWVVDDDPSIRWVLEKALNKTDWTVEIFESADQTLKRLADAQPQVLLTDVRMPGSDGFQLLAQMQADYADIPVIIMTAFSDLDSTVAAYQQGAFEYLSKPFDINEVIELIQRACDHYHSMHMPAETTYEELQSQEIIGTSPAIQEVFRAIGRLSKSSISVLITGESGTGKELIAHALHTHSPRAKKAFIALNTAAIPKDLLESELFGHEKGAFTGAHSQRKGRFEQAHEGTLFLDEIGDMPADLQTRLLRVLSDGEFYRVGGHVSVQVDVRIVAATHQNLRERVEAGLFREDLYHRLNVIRIHSPSLRERPEDIPLLLKHFLKKSAHVLQVEEKAPVEEVVSYLKALDWAGNVRQLENTAHWLTVMSSGREILLNDLPPELQGDIATHGESWELALAQYARNFLNRSEEKLYTSLSPVFERVLILAALEKTAGKKAEAAVLLGLGRNTLTRKIQDLGIHTN